METRIILGNFDPQKYNLDENDVSSLLGRGTYGSVYKAALNTDFGDSNLPEEAAVKCMEWKLPGTGYEETEINFLNVGLNFNNDNLVQIFAISMTKPRIAREQGFKIQQIFMELCEESLEDFIKERERTDISIDDLKHVTTGVLRGLAHLHNQKIIHRDIKPQNVLLNDPNGSRSLVDMTVKITDYNICKWSPEEGRTPTQTSRMGTFGFRAPEVLLARDDRRTHYDSPCDVWATGVLIFTVWKREAFVSEDEIRGENLEEILNLRIGTVQEERLQQFLGDFLKKSPNDRLTSDDLLRHQFLGEE